MERDPGARAIRGCREADGCRAEGAHSATPPVAEPGIVCPRAADIHAVVHTAVDVDSSLEESEIRADEPIEVRSALGLTHQNDESASDIVDAVAVIPAGLIQERVLEETVIVGHGQEVGEGR
jgi:hypothetical protein